MVRSHGLALDTAPEVRALQVARWAEASSVEKARMVEALCADVRMLALAGVRQRHPDASPRELALRVGALTIDRELMVAAFGWDPTVEGL